MSDHFLHASLPQQAQLPLCDLDRSPLWQQSLALEQGCVTFLRQARGLMSFRDWERLASGTWPLRRQIARAFRLDCRTAILERLAIARSTVVDLRVTLQYLRQQPELDAFVDQLSYLEALTGACSRQLDGWAELLAPPEAAAPPAPPERPLSDAEARWNDAFALLVQLETPRAHR